MSAKKIITVFGATGKQGGSVAKTFLTDPKLKDDWKVRGVTRDVNKESAQKLVAQGAEMVAADLDDKAALARAMAGAHTVYAMTNYWDKMDAKLEIQQGKNLADAAKETGVKFFIWATLPNVTKMTNGVLSDVYHFDSKAVVDDYIKSLGLSAAWYMPGMYMSNFKSFGWLRPGADDGVWTMSVPCVSEAAPMPLHAAAEDTGKFIKAIVLANGDSNAMEGKTVLGATDYRTVGETLAAFRTIFPRDAANARFVRLSEDQFRAITTKSGLPDYAATEMIQNCRLLEEFGYYGGASLDDSHALIQPEDKLTTFEEFAKAAWPDLK